MSSYAPQIDRLNDLGPRRSGNTAHRTLIDEVAAELATLGHAVPTCSRVRSTASARCSGGSPRPPDRGTFDTVCHPGHVRKLLAITRISWFQVRRRRRLRRRLLGAS